PALLGWLFVIALYAQILLGALMAGSGAARAYSDWPMIGHEWLPSTYAQLQPFWRNLAENHATIQFNHRTLGYVVAGLALALGLGALAFGRGAARGMALATLATAIFQAGLGIHTVMTGAPLDLSLAHQAGAVALWLLAIATMRANAMR
ncbi:MAG TPA: COX15/CtaA family protein, partial [Caulobacterales bacterium]|nr:COX15/CtaA family protein [Caulobacterales bacterium]